MDEVEVDVIIPLHRADRAIEKAVASVESSRQGLSTRVLVVLHGLTLDDAALRRLEASATVLLCDDGIPSPSGPRNTGLAAATAPFVFFLDSDDELAPNCLSRLHQVACTTAAEVVLPSIRGGDGYIGTPLVASRTPRLLDAVDDGLYFRSHSFALIRRSALASPEMRYPPGIRSGQDLVFMARLYAAATTAIGFDAVYRLVEHEGERVTTVRLPVEDQLAAVRHILTSDWMRRLPEGERHALTQRILAVNLASGWRRRRMLGHGPSATDHATMRALCFEFHPHAARLLSLRDRVTLRFTASPRLLERLLLAKVFGLVPTSVRGFVSRQGPLAIQVRSWMVRHRRRRTESSGS